MSKLDNVCIGSVVSLHRTLETAENADRKLQRLVKRANGRNSYLPTRIVQLKCRYIKGQLVSPFDVMLDE